MFQLKINPTEYFENNMRNLHFEHRKNLVQLKKTPEPYV